MISAGAAQQGSYIYTGNRLNRNDGFRTIDAVKHLPGFLQTDFAGDKGNHTAGSKCFKGIVCKEPVLDL